MLCIRVNWQAMPLTARVQTIQDIVEHFVERNLAFAAASGGIEVRSYVFIELFFG